MIIRSIVLNLVNDKHSKTYEYEIIQRAEGFIVQGRYGAVGSALTPVTKTKSPVSEAEAHAIFDKEVKARTSKRCDCCGGQYMPVTSEPQPPTPPARGARAPQKVVTVAVTTKVTAVASSHWFPELLVPIDTEEEAVRLLHNDNFCVEEKFDGKRIAIQYRDGQVTAFNKKSQAIEPPPSAEAAVRKLATERKATTIFFDGEYENGCYVVFDLLAFGGGDLRAQALRDRKALLAELLEDAGREIRRAKCYTGTKDKLAALESFHERGIEGAVFKHLGKPYMGGRLGVNRKLKYWASCTVRVCKKQKDDNHHSFAVEAFVKENGGGKWVCVGQVSCRWPTLPQIGTYREVKYLYLGVGERLYQPQDLGPRDDVDGSDCGFDQLKRKAGV